MKWIKQFTIFCVIGLCGSVSAQSPFNYPDNTGAGNALNFDGTNDFVRIANETNFDFDLASAFTFEFWIKDTDRSGVELILGKYTTSGVDYGYQIRIENSGALDRLEFLFRNTGGTSDKAAVNGVDLRDGECHHIAAAHANSSGSGAMNLYIDGVLQTLDEDLGDIGGSALNNSRLIIGKRGDYNDSYFNGEIDELRVWNVQRTQTQIRENMCKQLVGDETGLVGYWNLNDAANASDLNVTDNSGNGNDGTRMP